MPIADYVVLINIVLLQKVNGKSPIILTLRKIGSQKLKNLLPNSSPTCRICF